MDTVIYTDKNDNPVDIKLACFKIVNHQIHGYTHNFNKFRSMDLPTEKEYVAPEELHEQQDYSIVEDTLAKMNLNQGQQDVFVKENTYVDYLRTTKAYIVPFFKNKCIENVQAYEIQVHHQFLKYRQKSYRQKNLSASQSFI